MLVSDGLPVTSSAGQASLEGGKLMLRGEALSAIMRVGDSGFGVSATMDTGLSLTSLGFELKVLGTGITLTRHKTEFCIILCFSFR